MLQPQNLSINLESLVHYPPPAASSVMLSVAAHILEQNSNAFLFINTSHILSRNSKANAPSMMVENFQLLNLSLSDISNHVFLLHMLKTITEQ